MRRILWLCGLAALAACSSTPRYEYFTLGTAASGPLEAPVNVVVERFRTTEGLVRQGIMVSLSDTRVAYHPTARWAEGLGGLVQRRLAAAFGSPVPGRPTVVLGGTVLECGEVRTPSGRRARLRLEVEVRDPDRPRSTAPLLGETYEVERPVEPGDDMAPVVEALAAAADEIAARIARDLGEVPGLPDAAS